MPLFQTIADFEPLRVMVQLELTNEANLAEQLQQATRELARLCTLGQRYVAIFDCSFSIRLTPTERRMYADWIRENDPLLHQTLVGAAFVIPSPLIRGSLTTISWMVKLHAPYTVHANLTDALRWAIDCAYEAGLPLCPELRRRGVDALRGRAAAEG